MQIGLKMSLPSLYPFIRFNIMYVSLGVLDFLLFWEDVWKMGFYISSDICEKCGGNKKENPPEYEELLLLESYLESPKGHRKIRLWKWPVKYSWTVYYSCCQEWKMEACKHCVQFLMKKKQDCCLALYVESWQWIDWFLSYTWCSIRH